MSCRTRWRRPTITAVSAVLLIAAALTGGVAGGAQAAPAAVSTFWASPTGSGTACTQVAPCALETAVRDTDTSGGVVELLGGSYAGVSIVFTFNGAVTIEGAPGAHPVLTGVSTDAVIMGRGISGGSLAVAGLEISGGKDGIVTWAGVTVEDTYIHDVQEHGVWAVGGSNATMEVDDSTIAHSGSMGVVTAGASRIVDSTFYQNSYANVRVHTGEHLDILSSTLVGNGSFNVYADWSTLTIGGSIVGGNSSRASGCISPVDSGDAGGNISDDASCEFSAASSVNGSTSLDSSLGSLMDNGGATPTVALSATSPARGLVPASATVGGTVLCSVPDQRGQSRTAPCDAGAYQSPPRTAPTKPAISNLPTSPKVGGSFTASVSTNGDGATSVTSSTTGVCTVGGDHLTVSFVAEGTCTLVAHVAAGSIHTAADGNPQSVMVAKIVSTTPYISNLPPAAPVGASFTATVATSGDGAKSVTSSTPSVCTVNSTNHLTVWFVAAGTCTLVAHVTAGATHAAADGSPQSVMVAKTVPTTPNISNLPSAPLVGDSFTATVSTSGDGPTSVTSSTMSVCTVSSSNHLTVSFVAGGTCTLVAHVAAGAAYLAADGSPQSVTVAKTAQSIQFMAPAGGVVGDTVTLSATGGGSANPVVFTVDPSSDPGACTITGSTLTYTAAGLCVIDANQAGDVTYSAAPQVQQSVAVTAKSPIVTRPRITGVVSDGGHKTHHGWYSHPVTITFTCRVGSAALTTPCPAPITLRRSGRHLSVSRTITATDGGTATVTISGIKLDLGKPHLHVKGAKNGHLYRHKRTLHCHATDAVSGVASCRITRRHHTRKGIRHIRWRAVATDVAGNVHVIHGHYRIRRNR